MTHWARQIRAVASMPPADIADEWGDDDDQVAFQDDTLDDTVNVAAETLEAAAAAEKRGSMNSNMNSTIGSKTESPSTDPRMEAGAGAGPTRIPEEGREGPEASFDLAVLIRVASNGAIVTNKGGSEDLAGVVAYTQRLVDLVGELLGLERFVALECAFKSAQGGTGGNGPGGNGTTVGRCLLFAESNGDTVLVRPRRPDGNLQALRDKLGLS